MKLFAARQQSEPFWHRLVHFRSHWGGLISVFIQTNSSGRREARLLISSAWQIISTGYRWHVFKNTSLEDHRCRPWRGGGKGGGALKIGPPPPAQLATLQASSNSFLEPLRQIKVINNKTPPPPTRPPPPSSNSFSASTLKYSPDFTSQGENKQAGVPLPWRRNANQPAQPLTVCVPTLFVCLFVFPKHTRRLSAQSSD